MVGMDGGSFLPASNGLAWGAAAACAVLYLSSEPGDNVAVTVVVVDCFVVVYRVQTTATNDKVEH